MILTKMPWARKRSRQILLAKFVVKEKPWPKRPGPKAKVIAAATTLLGGAGEGLPKLFAGEGYRSSLVSFWASAISPRSLARPWKASSV
jgi:hypothetical protein